MANCHDCDATEGTPHGDGCDVARCLATGGQRLMCSMLGSATGRVTLGELGLGDPADLPVLETHDCGHDVWTGEWPGAADARRLGFWCYWGPDYGKTGWVECGPDHPGASPDLNRLHPPHAVWNPDTHRWEAP